MTDGLSKAELRIQAEARRSLLHKTQPDAGEALAELGLLELDVPAGAIVSGYWPIRSEIDPRPLMRQLASRGCKLALPVTPSAQTEDGLRFRQWSPGEPLSPGRFGVLEPSALSMELEPDLLLAPLLAFDRYGARIGYGAGYYDRTLSRLRGRKPIHAIGLAFADQEIEAAPQDPGDQRLNAILTERGLIEVC